MSQQINDTVTVRGERYIIRAKKPAGAAGAKFFGKFVFTLYRPCDGTQWRYLGKQVAHNSRLVDYTPVALPQP